MFRKNSFFIVCKHEFFRRLSISANTFEAFDMITLEEIERQLLNQ